jgi:hypothetical protein
MYLERKVDNSKSSRKSFDDSIGKHIKHNQLQSSDDYLPVRLIQLK